MLREHAPVFSVALPLPPEAARGGRGLPDRADETMAAADEQDVGYVLDSGSRLAKLLSTRRG